MIITTNFLIFVFLCAIAVKNMVDISFHSVRKVAYKILKKHSIDGASAPTLATLDVKEVMLAMFFDFVELVAVGYILFSTSLFIPVVLFSIVLANFLISWLAIICPTGYIFRKQVTRILWVYFSLNFGIFKSVVCVLSFLGYLMFV